MKPKCGIDGCGRVHYAKGYCSAHYNRMWFSGKVKVEKPIGRFFNPRTKGKCAIKECGKPHFAKTLCQSHYIPVRNFSLASEDSTPCEVDGCKFIGSSKGFCHLHRGMAKAYFIKNAAGM